MKSENCNIETKIAVVEAASQEEVKKWLDGIAKKNNLKLFLREDGEKLAVICSGNESEHQMAVNDLYYGRDNLNGRITHFGLKS